MLKHFLAGALVWLAFIIVVGGTLALLIYYPRAAFIAWMVATFVISSIWIGRGLYEWGYLK